MTDDCLGFHKALKIRSWTSVVLLGGIIVPPLFALRGKHQVRAVGLGLAPQSQASRTIQTDDWMEPFFQFGQGSQHHRDQFGVTIWTSVGPLLQSFLYSFFSQAWTSWFYWWSWQLSFHVCHNQPVLFLVKQDLINSVDSSCIIVWNLNTKVSSFMTGFPCVKMSLN